MKKMLLVLGMMISIFALTACGAKKVEEFTPLMTGEEAELYASNTINAIRKIVSEGQEEQYEEVQVVVNALKSYKDALEEMGNIVEIGEVTSEIGEKDATLSVNIIGEKRSAVIQMGVNAKEGLTDFTVNVNYSFGDLMTKAALNTVIGMGTVFAILILISVIISGFKVIPKIEEKFSKKPDEPKKSAIDHTIEQIIEKEELSDDLELVAVIAAAIAASEGQTSTDGFRVRSIKRANTNKWQRA